MTGRRGRDRSCHRRPASHGAKPLLRRLCPCAQCVNEFTGERVLKPEAVSEELKIEDVFLRE